MKNLQEKLNEFSKEYAGVEKVALSYSGGLDSVVVGTLLSEAGFKVVPISVDIGQQSDFSRIAKNARQLFGSCAVVDAKGAMADAIFRALKANFGEDNRMNSGGLTRPVLAHALSSAALKAGCQAVAHGSSGVGNDHIITENSLRVLAPELLIMAPVRDLDLKRDFSIEFAKKRRLPTNIVRAGKFSADESFWGRMIRQGISVDSASPLPQDAYKLTVSPKDAPASPQEITLEFEMGEPVALRIGSKKITGKMKILSSLNEIGGKHGVGRGEAFEDKIVGLKVREVFECPGVKILLVAHSALDEATLTSRELAAKRMIDGIWAGLVREGGWHTRLRRSLDAFIDETERVVDGEVTLELYKGSVAIKGRKSQHALYDTRLSARDSKGVFLQKEARHVAKLHGLQDLMAYMVGRN